MTGSPKGPGRTGAIHRGNLQNLVLLDLAPGRLNNTEVIVNAAEAVPKPVAEILGEPRCSEDVPGGCVHIFRGHTGSQGFEAGELGSQHRIVHFTMALRRFADHDRAGHVGTLTVQFRAEVQCDEISVLESLVGGMTMGTRATLTAHYDGRECQIGAATPKIEFDLQADVVLGYAGLKQSPNVEKRSIGKAAGITNLRDFAGGFNHPDWANHVRRRVKLHSAKLSGPLLPGLVSDRRSLESNFGKLHIGDMGCNEVSLSNRVGKRKTRHHVDLLRNLEGVTTVCEQTRRIRGDEHNGRRTGEPADPCNIRDIRNEQRGNTAFGHPSLQPFQVRSAHITSCWRLMRAWSASRYPKPPRPTICPTVIGEITDVRRNSSRACTFEMCTSTTGRRTEVSASRRATE